MFITLQAHQQGRRADALLKAGKHEESIICHKKAAGNVSEGFAMDLAL